MAHVNFTCPSCGQQTACNESVIGRKIRCPGCQEIQTVAQPSAGSPPAAPSAAARPGDPPGLPPPRPKAIAKPGGKPRARVSSIRVAGAGGPGTSPTGRSRSGASNSLPTILGGLAGALVFALLLWFLASGDGDAEAVDEPTDAAATAPVEEAGVDPMPERRPLSEADLAFVPRDAEALCILRFVDGVRDPAEKVAAGLPAGARGALTAFQRTFPVEASRVDHVAVAFSELRLGEWFGHRDRLRSYERRIARARSTALRNRLQSERRSLREPPMPRFLARIRLLEHVDLETLLAEVDGVQEVETEDGTYRKFRLPRVFGDAETDILAATATDSGEILFGHEALVAARLRPSGGRPLAELMLNKVDLDSDVVISFFPTRETRGAVRNGLIRKFSERDDDADFAEIERLGGAFAKVAWETGGEGLVGRVGVVSLDGGEVGRNRASVEGWLRRAAPGLDQLRGGLPVPLADAVAELVVGGVPVEDGLRVYLPFAMPAAALSQAGELFARSLARPASAIPTPAAPEPGATAAGARREAPSRPTAALRTRPTGAAPKVDLSEGRIVSGAPLSTVPTRALRGWTMNILNAAITEDPLAGRIVGRTFRPDEAALESGVLRFRMDVGQASETMVEVHGIQRIGEPLEGKAFEMPSVSGLNTPSVFFRWNDPTRLDAAVRRFYNRFAFKLEFGRIRDGRISGKLFIAVHDVDKSYLNGTFEAEIR